MTKTRPDPLTRMLARQGAHNNGPLALMYHSVTLGGRMPQWPWAISIEQFRAHLDYLAAQGFATITVNDLAGYGANYTDRTVAITFDDGYSDNLAAFEELQSRSMCATWFVVTGSIGHPPTWAATGGPSGRLLHADELRKMQRAGMEIGSHTVSHQRLTEAGAAEVTQELSASRARLEDLLGATVTSFAYPYGRWNAACESAVRAAGYLAACTTRTGWAIRDENPYRIRRLSVFNHDSTSRFARKLTLASHDVGWAQIAGYWGKRLRARLKGVA